MMVVEVDKRERSDDMTILGRGVSMIIGGACYGDSSNFVIVHSNYGWLIPPTSAVVVNRWFVRD